MMFAAPDEAIWVGVLRLSLTIPGARSLKDKRKSIARIRDRLRSRTHLSVAEVGHLQDRGRAILAIAMVSNDSRKVRSTLDGLEHEIIGWTHVLVAERNISLTPAFDDAVY